MYVSQIAFTACQDFRAFTADDGEVSGDMPDLALNQKLSPQLDELPYLTDWLHLWLLSGRGTVRTLGDFAIYMDVVTLASMYLEEIRQHRSTIKMSWPAIDVEPTDIPQVPDSVTIDMYRYCGQSFVTPSERSRLAWSMIEFPEGSRFRFLC